MSLHLYLSVGLLQADLGDHLAVLSVEIVNRSRREVTLQDVGVDGEGQSTSVLDVYDGVSWSALLDFPPPLTICSGERRAFGLSLQLFGDFLELHTVPSTFRAWADSAERMEKPSRVWSDLWLVLRSVAERGPEGQLYNTALLLSPEGGLTASYRKIFPWRPYEPCDPGTASTVAELPGVGRLGFSICFDAWFPEVARHLAWMGAEVIMNVVRTTTCDRAQEVVLARANAIMNQVFVVSVNAAGPAGAGQSLVVDPEDLIRASSPGAETTVLTDVLDLGHVKRTRTYGTAGLTRVWSQFQPGDPPLPLPLYDGQIDPLHWNGSQEQTT